MSPLAVSFLITLDPNIIWSWWGLIVMIVCAVVGLFIGSLPDNDHKPTGDVFRGILWVLCILWILVAFWRGITCTC